MLYPKVLRGRLHVPVTLLSDDGITRGDAFWPLDEMLDGELKQQWLQWLRQQPEWSEWRRGVHGEGDDATQKGP